MRTDYLLHAPSHDELREVFGSLDRAHQVTGGDIPTLCFYLANPNRIPVMAADQRAPQASGSYATDLKSSAQQEVIEAAYQASPHKTITEVERATGKSRTAIRKVLVAKGVWPKTKAAA